MQGVVGRIVLGFIAAAIAVLLVHESIIYALAKARYISPNRAWSMTPAIPPWGVPRLINNIFWGGLWGSLFAVLYERIPGGKSGLKGLVFGFCMVVVSNWLLLPLIKGRVFGQANQDLFSGWDTQRMLITLAIIGGFGTGLGVIYGLMVRGRTA